MKFRREKSKKEHNLSINSGHSMDIMTDPSLKKKIIVYVVGGMTNYELMQLRKLSEDDRLGIEVIPVSESFGAPVDFLRCLANKETTEELIIQKRLKKERSLALDQNEVSAVMMEAERDEGHQK